jgi:glycopeptide antibiotics resistance protein
MPFWCWWVALVWAVSFSWGGLTLHPQWHRVHWMPLGDPADKPRDIVANMLLFVPFGYSFARRSRPSFVLLRVLLAAAVVSVSAEALQLFSTVRFPSATDVCSAVIGALCGALPTFGAIGASKLKRPSLRGDQHG